jgi:hypothetical protein
MMISDSNSVIITCSQCNQQLFCCDRNPKRVLAGHLNHCNKKRKEDLILINYDNTYENYEIDYNSETESVIYPIENANEEMFNAMDEIILNPTYLQCQNYLMKRFKDHLLNPDIHQSRIVDTLGNINQGNIMDYIDIHGFMTRTCLSTSEGTEMLTLFRKIAKRQQLNLCIPTNMRSINDALDKDTHLLHVVHEVIIPYPPQILDVELIKKVKGFYLDPILILSEYLLNLEKEDIILNPIEQCTNNGVPIISSYASANQFKEIYQNVQQFFGRDCFPICLGVNYDSMALESFGKRSLKPLKISILNIKKIRGKVNDNVITIAFGPDFPYTDNEYENFLSVKVQTSSKRLVALQYLKRLSYVLT